MTDIEKLKAHVERLVIERDTFRTGYSTASNRCCELENQVENLTLELQNQRELVKHWRASAGYISAPTAGTVKDAAVVLAELRQVATALDTCRAMAESSGDSISFKAATKGLAVLNGSANSVGAVIDTKRLEFLGGPAVVSMHQYDPVDAEPYIAIDLDLPGSPTVRGPTLREAIDAAIEAHNRAGKDQGLKLNGLPSLPD